MGVRLFALLLLVAASPAQAYTFLTGYEEAPNVAAALERVKAQPQKHVLVYFGMSEFCPPCKEARAILNSDKVRAAYHRGTHWKERVDMAQWWSDHLDALRQGAQVLSVSAREAS